MAKIRRVPITRIVNSKLIFFWIVGGRKTTVQQLQLNWILSEWSCRCQRARRSRPRQGQRLPEKGQWLLAASRNSRSEFVSWAWLLVFMIAPVVAWLETKGFCTIDWCWTDTWASLALLISPARERFNVWVKEYINRSRKQAGFFNGEKSVGYCLRSHTVIDRFPIRKCMNLRFWRRWKDYGGFRWTGIVDCWGNPVVIKVLYRNRLSIGRR